MKNIKWIFLIIILISLFNIIIIAEQYNKSRSSYETMDNFIVVEPETSEKDEEVENKEKPNIKIDFEELKTINSDIVGWVYIENTPINYPIVQGMDNSYYLKHLFNNEYGIAGCIFLDCNNSSTFNDYNSVIYGHHMRDETMFTSIAKYKKQSYYNEHQTAIIITQDKTLIVELFAGFVADPNTDDAWKIEFKDEKEFEQWKEKIIAKSLFKSSYIPDKEDAIITFSTCSYEYDNARFVLYGAICE